MNRIRWRRACWSVVLLSVLAACSGLLPLGGPPPNLFTLSPKSTFDAALPNVRWQLVVEEPVAAGGLQVPNIALRTHALELQYYANARWTERAPAMVQTLLVESFENTGKIVSVGRQAVGLRSDFNLKTELREFQAEYGDPNRAPTIRVRLNAKVVRQPRRDIVASESFEIAVPAGGTAINDIILAFDDALGKVIRRTVEWTMVEAEKAVGDRGRRG
jgi:cholesterol transport system auxiliary component